MRKNKKHDGFKIFSRFLKERGFGFDAVTMRKNWKHMIDEEILSIWVFAIDLNNNNINDEWVSYVREQGYYDFAMWRDNGYHYVICQKKNKNND